MIVYDDRLEMDIEGFKALLRSRNERLGSTENYHGRIEFDADTNLYIICSVYMPDDVLGGWIAAERISPTTYHLQIYYLTDLWDDCSQYLRQLAWYIIEAYKGKAIANQYSENIYYVKIHDVVQILPFDDLSLKYFESRANHEPYMAYMDSIKSLVGNVENTEKNISTRRSNEVISINRSIGSDSPTMGIFRQDGECWHIEYGEKNKDVKDSKGMHYIHVLLSNPNKDIISTDLYRLGNKLLPEENINLGDEDHNLSITEDDDIYPMLDLKYKKDLLDAKEKLELEITVLHDAGGDPSDIREKEESLDIINKELSNSTRNGKSKNLNKSPLDKARQTISASIDRSYKNMRNKPDEMISLVRYLQSTIKRGKVFIYKDDAPVKWEL
jgi:hypothetical protein